jgi:membrane protein DedA with SNARE-associated domain
METVLDKKDLRRRRVICVTALALQGAYYYALLPAVPSLIGRDPVLLEALRGSTAAMVAGGAFARVGQASLLLALLAPFPTLLIGDPFVWWAGRLWGPDIARYLGARGPRGARRTRRAIRLLERYGSPAVLLAYFIPVPSALIYAAAGWTGMRLRRFLLLDVAGTALWVAVIVGLGYVLGRPAVRVAHAISHYSLLATIVIVALAVLYALLRARPWSEQTEREANGARPGDRV